MEAKTKKNILTPLLIIFFAIEALCVTNYKIRFFPFTLSTFLFAASGMAIALTPFLIKCDTRQDIPKNYIWIARGVFLFFIIIVTAFAIFQCMQNFQLYPIDYTKADMIPQIKACCERLLHHEKVYAPIPEIWNGLKPTYLPAMWIAYLPLEYLGIDVRWTSLIILLLFFGLYGLIVPGNKDKFFSLVTIIIICGFLFWFLVVRDRTSFSWTEEPVVMGYYLLLGFALIKKNPLLIAIACSLCFLSRYVLIFWIPFYLIYTFFFESKRKTIVIASLFGVIVLLIFIVPFFIEQPNYFISTPGESYRSTAKYIWINQPDFIQKSVSFDRFFNLNQINLLHQLVIISSLVVPVTCLVIFFVMRKRLVNNKQYFGLCSLKLTMLFFYGFIEIPYFYLFFVPVFFSIPIIFQSLED